MPRRTKNCFVLSCLAFLLLVAATAAAQYTHYTPDGDQIPGPDCLLPTKPTAGPPKTLHP